MISLKGFSLVGPEGPVFGPIDAEIRKGQLVAVVGPGGSGRSSLLMVLAGRLKGGRGEGPGADARDITSLARITGVVETDAYRKVGQLLRDQGLSGELPGDQDQRYSELSAADRLRIDVGLALASGAEAVFVDDVDDGLVPADLERAWSYLREVAGSGVAVVASACAAPSDVDAVIDLGRGAAA
ncbi:ABC transporter ATP-binding protein [Streptomyces sp. NPDC056773]|uniref:ATP-binding cassette domain-containing protein n=1 Tax=unclassified Streptomyces TaxID=2593676 RepID=UPI0020B76DEB|nr:ABC transporter ATP-binding protein [Streptomyces sp. TBY4]MCP3757997.1 ABC transporter ATP-binding protein [Streptomyces sp. TBY4]